MLSLSARGVEFIARFEGFSATPYTCPAGKLTIGYGHVIRPGESLSSITRAAALSLLRADAQRESAPVAAALHVPVAPHESDALISLAFNVGGARVVKSTLLQHLNAGRTTDAANEFLKWVYAGGKKLNGLVKRREAERALFVNAQYGDTP